MFVNKNNIDFEDKNRGPQSVDAADLLLNEEFCMLLSDNVRIADTQMYTDGDRRHIDIGWTPQVSKDVATLIESNMRVLASRQGLGVIDIASDKDRLSNTADINLTDYSAIVARNAEVEAVVNRIGEPEHDLTTIVDQTNAVKEFGPIAYNYALELSDDVTKALVNKFPDEDLDVLHSNALAASCESIVEHNEASAKADKEYNKFLGSIESDKFLQELGEVSTVETSNDVTLSDSDFADLKETGLQQ